MFDDASPAYEFSSDWFSPAIPIFQKHVGPLNDTACRILEIGPYEGRSTTWLIDHVMANQDARLDTIDMRISDVLRRNVEKTGRSGQVTIHEGRSRDVLRKLPYASFDFIYVDGSHATIEVIEDAVATFRLAKTGAIIAFDDYEWDEPPWNRCGTPKPALDFFLDTYARPTRHKPFCEVIEKGWQVWVRKLSDKYQRLP